MIREPLDIVVFLALPEEFKPLHELFGLKLSNVMPTEFGHWYEWGFHNLEGVKRNVLFHFTGTMGPLHLPLEAERLLNRFKPRILINAGLSGTVSDSVKLGDLVIASSVDLYHHEAKVIDDGAAFDIRFSGLQIPTEYFKVAVENFDFIHADRKSNWIGATIKERTKLIGHIEDRIPPGLLGRETNVHIGPICAGSFVVASDRFKGRLLQRNRKFLAVDMESAGVAIAHGSGERENGWLLIVRAASDPSNELKKKLEAIEGSSLGAIRKWAMLNIGSWLKEFLPALDIHGSLLRPKTQKVLGIEKDGFLVSEVKSHFEANWDDALAAYNDFFSHFLELEAKPTLFDHVLDRAENTLEPNSIAYIKGYPGTGKSAFLSCLYHLQARRFSEKKSEYFPVVLNMRSLAFDLLPIKKSADEIAASVYEWIENRLEEPDCKNQDKYMFIVDGQDEYFRHPAQPALDRVLVQSRLKLIAAGRGVKMIGALGELESAFINRPFGDSDPKPQESIICSLKRVTSDYPLLDVLIGSYCKISPSKHLGALGDKIKELIKKFEIKDLDLFLFSLLDKAIGNGWNTQSRGIGPLYFEYCCHKIWETDIKLSKEECREKIRELSERVFKTYVCRQGYGKLSGEATSIDLLGFHMPHIHASVKEFLIAEHLVANLGSGKIKDTTLLGYIYPYGIYRFMKSIMNRDVELQGKIFEAIRKSLAKSKVKQKIQMCYLLGRFEDRGIRQSAKDILKQCLSWVKKTWGSVVWCGNNYQKQLLLLERTAYISLIYLGDVGARREYINLLVDDPVRDDLNRGFHLEYYEDVPRAAMGDTMIGFDLVDAPMAKTFDILYERMRRDLKALQVREMMQVELHTLCSLCLNRHLAGRLEDQGRNADLHRKKMVGILNQVLERPMFLISGIQIEYLQMAKDILSRERVSVGEIVSEMVSLKRVPRTGWNFRGKINGREVFRECAKPESVADHTYGCLILAEVFLPEDIGVPGFDKRIVKDILLFHDLAEAYFGDIPRPVKKEGEKNREGQKMRQLAALSSMRNFEGIKGWRLRWEDYAEKNSINSKVAHDIDVLENYFELIHLYQEQLKGNAGIKISDALEWATEMTRHEIETEIGKKILGAIAYAGAGPLEWYPSESKAAMGLKDTQVASDAG